MRSMKICCVGSDILSRQVCTSIWCSLPWLLLHSWYDPSLLAIRATKALEIIDLFVTMPYLLPPSQALLINFCAKSSWVAVHMQNTGAPGFLHVEDLLQPIGQGQVTGGRQGRMVLYHWPWKLKCNLAYKPNQAALWTNFVTSNRRQHQGTLDSPAHKHICTCNQCIMKMILSAALQCFESFFLRHLAGSKKGAQLMPISILLQLSPIQWWEGGVNYELCSTAPAFLSLIQGLALILPWEMPKHFQIKQIYSCIFVLNVYVIGGPKRWQQVGRLCHLRALAWTRVMLLWLCVINNATG